MSVACNAAAISVLSWEFLQMQRLKNANRDHAVRMYARMLHTRATEPGALYGWQVAAFVCLAHNRHSPAAAACFAHLRMLPQSQSSRPLCLLTNMTQSASGAAHSRIGAYSTLSFPPSAVNPQGSRKTRY